MSPTMISLYDARDGSHITELYINLDYGLPQAGDTLIEDPQNLGQLWDPNMVTKYRVVRVRRIFAKVSMPLSRSIDPPYTECSIPEYEVDVMRPIREG